MHPELIANMADAHRAELHHRAEQRRLVRAGAPQRTRWAALSRVPSSTPWQAPSPASSRTAGRPPWRARLGNRLIDAGLALVGRAERQRGVSP